jgi:hypothetical protein
MNYITSDTTLDNGYQIDLLDASGGSFTVTLFNIDGDGDEVYLSRVDNNALGIVTIKNNDGSNYTTMLVGGIIHLISYGGVWYKF